MSAFENLVRNQSRTLGWSFIALALLAVHVATFHFTPLLLALLAGYLAFRQWNHDVDAPTTPAQTPSATSLYAHTFIGAKLLKVRTIRRSDGVVLNLLLDHDGLVKEDLDPRGVTEKLPSAIESIDYCPLNEALDDASFLERLAFWMATGEKQDLYLLASNPKIVTMAVRPISAKPSRALD